MPSKEHWLRTDADTKGTRSGQVHLLIRLLTVRQSKGLAMTSGNAGSLQLIADSGGSLALAFQQYNGIIRGIVMAGFSPTELRISLLSNTTSKGGTSIRSLPKSSITAPG
jgi:hypothetical protein